MKILFARPDREYLYKDMKNLQDKETSSNNQNPNFVGRSFSRRDKEIPSKKKFAQHDLL